MELSLLLGQQIIVIAVMIVIGFSAGKAKLIDMATSEQLARVVLYVICPCMFIDAFQQEFSINRLRGLILSLVAAVLAHIMLIVLAKAVSRGCRMKEVAQASMIYSNCGNLLVPVVGYMLGGEFVFYCSAFILVQTILIWTHCIGLISGEKKIEWKKIITNPNILAIFVGLILFFGNITLPEFLGAAVNRIAGCVGPLSMIVIGILISNANLKEVFLDKKTWLVTIVRLLLCPTIYVLMLMLFHAAAIMPEAKSILYVSFLAVAAPSASSISQMASILHKDEVLAGSINIMTVLLCMITMPLMTIVYQMLV